LALTAAELLLMGLLLRFAQAGPRGLSRVAVVAAIGCCAALGEQLAPGSWLLLPSLLLFALPWFLFRLSKLVLPNTAGAIAG
jgi:hypothetical protein